MMVERVYDILRELRDRRDVTLLLIEESTERAVDISDRIYVLRRGLIELEGSSDELADGARLQQAYFGFGDAGGDAAEETRP
jgi:branched-chain amino acid transport system ATP-binding protein